MIGILLTNTGTPDAATTSAVRRYLREFLSDKRIVHIPRFIWLPILYGLILPFRAPKSAKLYQEIWTAQGSPMRVHMETLRSALEAALNEKTSNQYCVAVGMNYSSPSIAAGMKKLHASGAKKIIVLPLFPQYSDTSTASSFDRVEREIPAFAGMTTSAGVTTSAGATKSAGMTTSAGMTASAGMTTSEGMTTPAEIIKIRDYHDHPAYISALATSMVEHWQQHGKSEHLLISFHGIPERFAAEGDPYPIQCARTAHLLAEELQLTPDQWTLCYQSQFGYDKWLKPSTQALLTELPQRGIKTLDIICPGFAVDCLETLEEIATRGGHDFKAAGGDKLSYICALNSNQNHINALTRLIAEK